MLKHDDRMQELFAENERLKLRLQEAEEVLDAIRCGEVDALVVSGPDSDQVYTLGGADRAYRILFETMNEGAAILGSDGSVFFCNTKLSSMLKRPMETILGEPILRFVSTEDSPSFEAMLNRGLEEPQNKEFTLKSHDGNIVPCHISTSPFSVEDSSNICMIVTDITERKQAESHLRESEEQFRAIFEGSEDAIWIKDKDLRITHVNPAMTNIFGLSSHVLIAIADQEIFGGESIKYNEEVDLRVLEGESVEEQRTVFVRGAKAIWNIAKVPLRNPSGEVVGICGIARNVTAWQKLQKPFYKDNVSYQSESMRSALKSARIAAEKESIILLLGESGSGKDYLARYIHDHSNRANGPYFSINCAAIVPELAESELFGHERGAFTGAHGRKRGLLELAEGGTLLLNEIGELTLSLQSKLLSFLDTRSFLRVGGEKSIRANARIIAATNRSLETEVAEGRFLSPLIYRLNVFPIHVPPLRYRIEDIPVLLEEIMSRLAVELQLTSLPAIDPASIIALARYHWPGNVRELRNVIERSLILSDGKKLNLALPSVDVNHKVWSHVSSFPEHERTLHDVTDDAIESLVLEALRRCDGNRTCAARTLGIARDSLYRHMKRFGIEYEDRTKSQPD